MGYQNNERPDEPEYDRDVAGGRWTDGEAVRQTHDDRSHGVQRRNPIPEDEDAPGISPGHGWLIGAS